MPSPPKIGTLIKSARNDANLTAVELARLLKVSKVFVSKLEHGLKTPSWIMIQKISKILKRDDLLYRFIVTKFPGLEKTLADIRRTRAIFSYDDSTIQLALQDSISGLFDTDKKDKDIALNILQTFNFETPNVELLPRLELQIKNQRLLLKDLREELKKGRRKPGPIPPPHFF